MSRLPSHLFQTYSSYKRGTREVIEWLHRHTGHGCNHCFVNSVRTIEYLAQVAIEKKIKVPASFLRTLKSTIRAREKVAAYFCSANNEKDEINSSHLFFAAILLRIYQDLLVLAATTPCEVHTTPEYKAVLRSANIFACLNNCERQPPASGQVHNRSCCPQNVEHVRHSFRESADHDIIGETLTINLYLSELQKILDIVQNSWRETADGSFPIVVASLVTSVAYQELQTLQAQLHEYNIHDPETLISRIEFCMGHLRDQTALTQQEHQPASQPRGLVINALTLRECWHALLAYKRKWRANATASHITSYCCQNTSACKMPPFDDPTKSVMSLSDQRENTCTGGDCHKEHLDLLMKRMGQAMKRRSNGAARIAAKSPVLHDFTRFLQDEANGNMARDTGQRLSSNANSLCAGILLLLESSGSYLRRAPESQLPPPNVRIMSLKLASELKSGVQNVLKDLNAPCGCLEINGHKVLPQLGLSIHILGEFTSTKNFDLYHQNPWLSGTHMIHNLSMASEYGLQTWHHGYFVGILLHIYNSLTVLGALDLDALPVMEKICEIFTDMAFLGSRPRRNLASCFRRWSGARLKFPNKRCHTMHTHDKPLSSSGKKWAMESARDVSQGGDDSRRSFRPSKVSLFALIATRASTRDVDVLARIQDLERQKNAPTTGINKTRRLSEISPADHISSIRAAVLKEFQDELPVAKLNYFKLYETFCEILRRISSAEHESIERDYICSCVTDRLLRAVDRYLDDVQCVKVVEERELVEICVDTMKEVLEGKDLVDFTWRL